MDSEGQPYRRLAAADMLAEDAAGQDQGVRPKVLEGGCAAGVEERASARMFVAPGTAARASSKHSKAS